MNEKKQATNNQHLFYQLGGARKHIFSLLQHAVLALMGAAF